MKLPRWKIFNKFDLSKAEDKLKLFIIISGVLIFISIGTATAIKLTMYPTFCSTCHEMTPEYVTWKASSHSQISCTDCHIKPGLINLITHKLEASKEVFLHLTDSYEKPIKMVEQIDQETCKQCHSNNRNFSLSGDLKVPHDKHSKKNINCVACHTGIAHGNIVSEGLTKDGNYSSWTQTVAAKQMVRDNMKPRMSTCIDCHTKRGVTTRCEACHTTISEPKDHKDDSWKTIHGKKAEKDFLYCNKCHSYSEKGDKNKATVTEFVRGNSFCSECHKKRPAGHTDSWMSLHSSKALVDKTGCLICHNQTKPKTDDNVTQTYCDKCHGSQTQVQSPSQGSENTTKEEIKESTDNGAYAYHDKNWRKNHPLFIKEQGIQKGKCFSCHETTQCSKCHTSNGKLH